MSRGGGRENAQTALLNVLASRSSNAQTEGLRKDGWYSIDRDLNRWSLKWSRIAGQLLLPVQTPMRPMCSCERAKCWRRIRSGLSIDGDQVVSEPLHPCPAWLTSRPVVPEDRMGLQADTEVDALRILTEAEDAGQH